MPRRVLDIWAGEREIDLGAWKAEHDIWAVICKCGGHEYLRDERGVLMDVKTYYEDSQFLAHYQAAHREGLHCGAYYYGSATTPEEAAREAEHCASILANKGWLDMPVYYDVEERSQLDLHMHQLTKVVTAFCERVRAAGYEVGIYSGYEGFHNMFEADIAGYSLWVAAWRASWPIWAKDYDLWQEGSMDLAGNVYRDEDTVDGPGHVDLDWASDAFVTRIEKGGGMAKKLIDTANVAALIHYDMVTDPRNGYSQSPRWGGDHPDGIKVLDIDGHRYEYPLGSYDCSSSVTMAWRQALRYTAYEGCLGDNIYERTASMEATYCGTGLFAASLTPAHRGDLYLSPRHHTAMCQDGGSDGMYGWDCLSEFNRDENHQASGGQPGDQDGGESVFRGYYDYPWTTVLHYVGGLLEDVTDEGSDDGEKEKEMAPAMMFVRLDGTATEHFFDGQHLHAVANLDEKKAIIDFYALAGVTVDATAKEFGSATAPFGARLNDVLSRGAEFKGFERFNKHPSTRAVVREVVSAEVSKVAIDEAAFADLVAEKVVEAIGV